IGKLNDVVDLYGVGTSISSAPVLDFAMDIVEIDGQPLSKRGKFSGEKQVYLNRKSGARYIDLASAKARKGFIPLLNPQLEKGKVLKPEPSHSQIRDYVLKQIKEQKLDIESKSERR
ncbi:MAG: nicotinate phosphoribosyltransferase, partial [Bacteroidetes bacterium]|nr:nicotinate phosphoribosyltransferase [Bacteroidota bacterium]